MSGDQLEPWDHGSLFQPGGLLGISVGSCTEAGKTHTCDSPALTGCRHRSEVASSACPLRPSGGPGTSPQAPQVSYSVLFAKICSWRLPPSRRKLLRIGDRICLVSMSAVFGTWYRFSVLNGP